MSYYINLFLSTELTCIPKFMDKYVGEYYSNTAGNALTWVFVLWNVLHFIFDGYLDVLLKKMQFKPYVRKRLVKSLWCIGFYGTSLLYCYGSIWRNHVNIFDYNRNTSMYGGLIPPHIVLGLGLFGSFFFHTCTWNMIKYGPDLSSCSSFLLTTLPLFVYFTRKIEMFLCLLSLISLCQFNFNLIRCFSVVTKTDRKPIVLSFFYISLGVFAIIHVIIIPLFFIVPLLSSLVRNSISASLIALTVNILGWWASEAISNPLYKYIFHWVYHLDKKERKNCAGTIVECSMFSQRNDVAFNLTVIQKEIKERKDMMISRRKPKNRGMLIQTLKCVMAIRRKLNKKRNSESSEASESESERDRAEKDSGSEEESSEENSDLEDDEKREAKQYKEETARALLEDQESANTTESGSGEEKLQNTTVDNCYDDQDKCRKVEHGYEQVGRELKSNDEINAGGMNIEMDYDGGNLMNFDDNVVVDPKKQDYD